MNNEYKTHSINMICSLLCGNQTNILANSKLELTNEVHNNKVVIVLSLFLDWRFTNQRAD